MVLFIFILVKNYPSYECLNTQDSELGNEMRRSDPTGHVTDLPRGCKGGEQREYSKVVTWEGYKMEAGEEGGKRVENLLLTSW